MWFATGGGLDRYDGATFVHYGPRVGGAIGLDSRIVMTLLQDRSGRLWAGGGSGLSLYDREMDRFTTYPVTGEPGEQIDERRPSGPRGPPGPDLGCTEAGRLYEFDPAARSFRALDYERGRAEWPCLLEDRAGRLWVGTAAGLDRYDEDRRSFVTVAALEGIEVTDLLQDDDGTLWVATLGSGLNRLAPETLSVRRYLPDPQNAASIATRRVRKLGRDRDGHLYVGTENGGLDVFDPHAETFVHHVFDREDPGSIGNNSVWAIDVDDQGIVWVGTYGDGVSFATPQGQRLGLIKARRGGLSDPHVNAVLEDHRGDLWIGTDGGGLNRVDRKTDSYTYYRHDPADPTSLPSDAVWRPLRGLAAAALGRHVGWRALPDRGRRSAPHVLSPQACRPHVAGRGQRLSDSGGTGRQARHRVERQRPRAVRSRVGEILAVVLALSGPSRHVVPGHRPRPFGRVLDRRIPRSRTPGQEDGRRDDLRQ